MQALKYVTCISVVFYLLFKDAAPVRNSITYLNLGQLTAGDYPSLKENKSLLSTFFAFSYAVILILAQKTRLSIQFAKKGLEK